MNGQVAAIQTLLRVNANLLFSHRTFGHSGQKVHSSQVVQEELVQHVRGDRECGGASGGVYARCSVASKGHVGTMAVLAGTGVVDDGRALANAVRAWSRGTFEVPALSYMGGGGRIYMDGKMRLREAMSAERRGCMLWPLSARVLLPPTIAH